ncbi:hypothetical protein EVAR_41147_1 [Eumeta japonica]|uniref:Uncharacterized protein n=1 Tax=Eumeta variegata TaxID=151549 RepID=A0A4C1Y9E9_EUMVA|nr:hypothetical protein EVAR_41147_1 [Eumeta japonica]
MTPRKGPVKAAIIILDSGVDVEEDKTLIDENVTATVIKAGNCRIGVVSVYFEGQASPLPRRRSGPRLSTGTRVYNTVKARWSEFGTAMNAALTERTLTFEMVKSVGSCDQFDEVVETYTECIRQACESAIPPRNSERRLKLPW